MYHHGNSAKTADTRDRIKEKYNIQTVEANVQTAKAADILFLAVKPLFLAEVIAEIREAVKEDALIVSIAAGRDLNFLKEAFHRPGLKIIRCMPNTPALVLEGCTGVCAGEEVSPEDLDRVVKLMSSLMISVSDRQPPMETA